MSRKSAVSEYQALERKGGPGSRKETTNSKAKCQQAEAKREQKLVELWPEVQQECRDGYREWIQEHSKADDRAQGIKMLQALIERLQKFGFDQKAKRFERSLFCSDAESVPSLLDRLRFPRDDGDEFEEWQGVNDAIVGFLASELVGKKPDALQLASELRKRLEEITKQQTPQANTETSAKGQGRSGRRQNGQARFGRQSDQSANVNKPAQEKLQSAFKSHHKYKEGGSIGDSSPITIRKLAEMAGTSTSTSKAFFDWWFQGIDCYKSDCLRQQTKLRIVLMQIQGESLVGAMANYGTDPNAYHSDDD